MKKILLGTTTLFGAALLAGAAYADGPKVTLGGFSDFQVGIVGEDNDANQRAGAFRSDNEVSLKIDGKTDAGLGYGGQINLEADTNDDVDSQGANASRTFVYLDGMWGRLQMGSDLGVTNTMKIGAESIARATGGIDGDWTYFDVGTTGPGGEQVIATPDLMLDYGSGQFGNESTENLNKVSYYTPRFAGFQAGVSYLFDTNSTTRGQTVDRGDNTAGEAENVFLAGLNWEGKFDQVSLGVAATGEFGSGETTATEDLRTWNVGAKAGFMGFSIAGSYGDWGDSLSTTAGLSDRNYWTLGAAYEMGAFGASVTYLDSTYEEAAATDNTFQNISVGVDYKMAPGFTPYAEVSFFEVDGAGGTDTTFDNEGTVFIAGTQLAF